MKGSIIGIVNFHTAPEVPPLTNSRPLGSTSFLGRYALCDFALSNLCNSGISNVGLLIKDHPRSILKHLGTMDAWCTNTKIGKQTILYNEPAHLHPETNTDINNMKENDWVLYDTTATQIVFVPSHLVAAIDFRPILAEHIALKRKITVVCKEVEDLSKEFLGSYALDIGEGGVIAMARVNDGSFKGKGAVSLGIIIIDRAALAEMLDNYLPRYLRGNLAELLSEITKDKGSYTRYCHFYNGYARSIDSFQHYMDYSFELLNPRKADALFSEDWPIYTLTHDTPPALYGVGSAVSDSYVANGAIVEGKLTHSIIARNVKIGKGAVVKNSIIFSDAKIGENAHIENALIDKFAVITRGQKVIGGKEPAYVGQGEVR